MSIGSMSRRQPGGRGTRSSSSSSWLSAPVRAEQDDLPTPSSTQSSQKAGRRPDQRDRLELPASDALAQSAAEFLRLLATARQVGIAVHQSCQAGKGRIARLLPKGALLVVKGGIVVSCSGLDGIVLGRVGLDDRLPTCRSSSCPPCDLRQQLKGPFGRPKVGQV